MAEVKYTKNELRNQQVMFSQLQRYLPTLQLKKAMLQAVIQEIRQKALALEEKFLEKKQRLSDASTLLSEATSVSPEEAAHIVQIHKRYENIAGVEVPEYEGVTFTPFHYHLIEAPPWMDGIVLLLRATIEVHVQVTIIREQLVALERELHEVSIRVNLFEKVLIPRALSNIKRIKIFLGDQQLASVARSKIAKMKALQRIKSAAHKNEENNHAC